MRQHSYTNKYQMTNQHTRFLTYLCIGIIDTLIDIFILYSFIQIFGSTTFNILIFNPISYTIAVICSFFLNGTFTFKDNNLTFKKFLKLYTSSSFGLILNTAIVTFLIGNLGLHIAIAKIIAACIVVFYNYTMCRKFIFRSDT